MEDLNPHYWVKQNAVNEALWQVEIRYLVSPKLPLLEGMTNVKVIEERKLSIQQPNAQGSVFHVTPDQWDAILQTIGGWPAPEIEDAELAVAELAGKNRSGQGFRMDVAARQAIEQHVMQTAKIYYEELGWAVTDVSATCSYDLVCKRNNREELHVEVKGTTSDGQQILLTRNEVEHARYRYPHVALFVLANIKIEKTSTGGIRPGGGERHLLEPWNVDDGMLTPLAYAYKIKMSEKNREEVK
ncbi:MAG: protein NO VEIN domain-containing protein [Ktedonobacteraceae bacterium]